MAITRGQMQRQLRRGGGIMNITPREQFGIGSSLKKFVRKVIPNEVSKVATFAAPFVAPFNPAVAAAMAGIGSFDQTGSLSGALKSGALTYGGGQLARYAGGAGFQGNPFTSGGAFTPSGFTAGFSSPLGTSTGIGKLLGGPKTTVEGVGGVNYSDMSQFNKLGLGGSNPAGIAGTRPDLTLATGDGAAMEAVFKNVTPKVSDAVTRTATDAVTKTVTESAPKSVIQAIKNQDYFEAAKLAAEKGTKALFTTPITDAQGNVTGSKLDKTMLLAAGTAGLSYLDAKKLADEMGEDIGTEEEYDEATKEAKRAEYAGYLTNFFEGKKDGGRIGFDEGANTKFAMIKDMLAKGMDADTIMSIAGATQEEIDSVKNKRVEEAQGGRIGFADGTDKKLKEILEMDMTIPKSRNDPRNMTTNEILFAIEDGRATPEMFEELLLRDVGGISTLMLDEIGGKKLDEPKKVYEFNPSESRQGGAIENLLFKLRESNPDIYGEYSRPKELSGFLAAPSGGDVSLPRFNGLAAKAEGGRIGFKEGSDNPFFNLIEKISPLFVDEKGDYRSGLQKAKFALSDFVGGKGYDYITGAEWYNKLDDDTQMEILLMKQKIRDNPERYGFSPRMKELTEQPVYDEEFAGKFGFGSRYAQGGRIGYMFGDKVEDEEGIMSMSEDKKDENMKMAYFPGDVFSKAEISKLFRDKSLTTNEDRKQLFRILMNPGMFPEAEEMLKKMLRGKQDGGRIGFNSGSSRPSQLFKLLEEAEAMGDMDKVKEIKSDLFREFGLKLAKGGRINYNMGSEVPVRKNKAGIEELDYRQTGGFVPVGVKEKADDVPAMLSKNEFVLTADAVRGIGGGDVEKGAEKLYGVMKQAEKVGRA